MCAVGWRGGTVSARAVHLGEEAAASRHRGWRHRHQTCLAARAAQRQGDFALSAARAPVASFPKVALKEAAQPLPVLCLVPTRRHRGAANAHSACRVCAAEAPPRATEPCGRRLGSQAGCAPWRRRGKCHRKRAGTWLGRSACKRTGLQKARRTWQAPPQALSKRRMPAVHAPARRSFAGGAGTRQGQKTTALCAA